MEALAAAKIQQARFLGMDLNLNSSPRSAARIKEGQSKPIEEGREHYKKEFGL